MNLRKSISAITLASFMVLSTGVSLLTNTSKVESKEVTTALKQDGDSPVNLGLTGSERPSSDPLQLLQNSQIVKELSMTPDQVNQIKQIDQNLRSELKKIISGVNWSQLSPADREKKYDELSTQIEQQVESSRTKVGQVLKPEQLARFRGISLQIYGWGPLTYTDFVEPLKLTTDQQTKLKTLREEMLKQIRASWQIPPTNNNQERNRVIASNRKRLEQIIKESNTQALALLTPDQQKNLETLKGAEFKLDPSTLPSGQ